MTDITKTKGLLLTPVSKEVVQKGLIKLNGTFCILSMFYWVDTPPFAMFSVFLDYSKPPVPGSKLAILPGRALNPRVMHAESLSIVYSEKSDETFQNQYGNYNFEIPHFRGKKKNMSICLVEDSTKKNMGRYGLNWWPEVPFFLPTVALSLIPWKDETFTWEYRATHPWRKIIWTKTHMGVSTNTRVPQNGWWIFMVPNPMNKWMIWGENPLFLVQHPYHFQVLAH